MRNQQNAFLPRGEFQPALKVETLWSFESHLILWCGIVFEIPVLMLLLARIGIATPAFMIHWGRYAILIIFILAALITPTGDPMTLLMFALPMVALYGLGIVLAKIFGRKPE